MYQDSACKTMRGVQWTLSTPRDSECVSEVDKGKNNMQAKDEMDLEHCFVGGVDDNEGDDER